MAVESVPHGTLKCNAPVPVTSQSWERCYACGERIVIKRKA